MDELIGLTPGQMVIMDGVKYVTLQTEDGSIALQEVQDFQQVIEPNTNTLPTYYSNDEAKISGLDESHIPVDLSLANLQLHNANTTTDACTDHSVFNQQNESIFQGLSTENMQNQDSNVVPMFSDQAVAEERERLSMLDQIQQATMPKTSAPVVNNVNMLASEKLSEASTGGNSKQEILDFIQNLHSRGYILDQDTTNLLMNGEVSISDFPDLDDPGLNQRQDASVNDSNNSQHFSYQPVDDSHAQRSNETHVHPIRTVPENLQIQNSDNWQAGVDLNQATSTANLEKKQEASLLIQNLQSRGLVLDQNTIDLLMSGEDYQLVDETGLPLNFEQTTNIEPLGCINQKDVNLPPKAQVVVKNIEEDEEFLLLKSHDSHQGEDASVPIIPERQPVSSAYQQAYLNFVDGFKSDTSYDKVLDYKTAAQPVGQFTLDDRDGTLSYFDRAPSSRGRGRGGTKYNANGYIQKRWSMENENVYGDPRWKGSEHSIRSMTSNVRAPAKRGVGRPRGSGRKQLETLSDDDFDTDDFESDEDSDYSGGSWNRGRRGRRIDVKKTDRSFTNNRSSVQSQGQRGRRGRGRPRKNVWRDHHPDHGKVVFASLGDVHSYEEGCFVIYRTNWLQDGLFNILEICEKSLMKVYKAVVEDNDVIYRTQNSYHLSNIDVRICHKAIDVEHLPEKNAVKPKIPQVWNIENLENDPLMSIFNVFIHVLCCQSLDENYFLEIMSGNYEHLYGPLRQIDEIIKECLISIQSKITWNPLFRESMDSLRFYKIYNMTRRPDVHYLCNEIDDPNLRANMVIQFFGPRYNYDTLRDEIVQIGGTGQQREIEYFINSSSVEHIRNYHALRHFKITIFKELRYILTNRQLTNKDKSNEEHIQGALSDNKWMNFYLGTFKEMILKADVILEVAPSQE